MNHKQPDLGILRFSQNRKRSKTASRSCGWSSRPGMRRVACRPARSGSPARRPGGLAHQRADLRLSGPLPRHRSRPQPDRRAHRPGPRGRRYRAPPISFTDAHENLGGHNQSRTQGPRFCRMRRWCGWPGSNRHSSRNWILKGVAFTKSGAVAVVRCFNRSRFP